MNSPRLTRSLGALRTRIARQQGSAAVEYVGLGVVVSMLMAAAASVVDSSAGERLAQAIVNRLLDQISGS
jgi:Flp pilus assembly pilin Flp